MTAVTYNALKLAQRFQDKAKFPPEQAEQAALAVAECFAEWQETLALATKSDIADLGRALGSDITNLRLEAKTDVAELEGAIQKTRNDVSDLRRDTKADIGNLDSNLRREIPEMKVDLIKWVVGIGFAQAAMIISILKWHL